MKATMKTLHPTQPNNYQKAARWIQNHPHRALLFTFYLLIMLWVILLIAAAITEPPLPHYSGV